MTKIFHIITTIERGGAENQLLILAKEQIKQGFEVHVVYLKGEPELRNDFSSVGVHVHSEACGVNPLLQPFIINKLLPSGRFIVHAHLPRAELVASLILKKISLVVSRHNTEPFFPSAPRFISNILSNFVAVRSKYVIAISNSVKDYLISRGEIHNTSKIKVVHYGYINKFNDRQVLKKSNTPLQRIGTIARLTDQKDIPTLIEIFQKYISKNPLSTLSIVGAGPLEPKLKAEVKLRKLTNSVKFLGRSANIYEFLQSLDVFILTSKYEGFGMVLLEAMDAQIPVLASNNSAIPEVLGQDFPGLCETSNVSDFYSKLIMLNESEVRTLFLEKQEERLSGFQANRMAIKIRNYYEN